MCLAVPAKVIDTDGKKVVVETLGEKTEAKIEPTNSVSPSVGDWVIVQFGMVTQIIDEKSAMDSIKEWKQIMNM